MSALLLLLIGSQDGSSVRRPFGCRKYCVPLQVAALLALLGDLVAKLLAGKCQYLDLALTKGLHCPLHDTCDSDVAVSSLPDVGAVTTDLYVGRDFGLWHQS